MAADRPTPETPVRCGATNRLMPYLPPCAKPVGHKYCHISRLRDVDVGWPEDEREEAKRDA